MESRGEFPSGARGALGGKPREDRKKQEMLGEDSARPDGFLIRIPRAEPGKFCYLVEPPWSRSTEAARLFATEGRAKAILRWCQRHIAYTAPEILPYAISSRLARSAVVSLESLGEEAARLVLVPEPSLFMLGN